jgi:hypothetical protein
MHRDLTEHARCLYGDEYRPTRPCPLDHREHCFVGELTFAGADSILAMLHEPSPHLVDGHLPVRIRNLAYRPVLAGRGPGQAAHNSLANQCSAYTPSLCGAVSR